MDKPSVYEIRVEGHLSDRWVEWFEGLEIHALNLTLISMNRLTPQK